MGRCCCIPGWASHFFCHKLLNCSANCAFLVKPTRAWSLNCGKLQQSQCTQGTMWHLKGDMWRQVQDIHMLSVKLKVRQLKYFPVGGISKVNMGSCWCLCSVSQYMYNVQCETTGSNLATFESEIKILRFFRTYWRCQNLIRSESQNFSRGCFLWWW